MSRSLLLALVLIVLTLAAFGGVGRLGFVDLDDPLYVTANPTVQRGLSAPGLGWAFTSVHAANWHPLTWLSHMADVELFGLAPRGHHLVNLALHLLNTLVLFAALARLSGALVPSALAAALFAIHPQRVEVVAWVSERKELLAGTFFALTLLAYSAYARRGGWPRYALVALLLALGLMAKPTLVTLPALLLALDFWPLQRLRASTTARLLIEKIPLLLLALAAGVATLLAQRGWGALGAAERFPLGARLANALVACASYLGETLAPHNLSVLQPHPAESGGAWSATAVVGSALLLAALSALCFFQRRRRPWLALGWCWFLLTLVPMIGLVQAGAQARADRYTYLAAIGLYLMIAWSLAELARARPYLRHAVPLACAALLAAAVPLTRRQVSYWKNTETLARHALAVTGPNWRAHLLLGRALRARGHTAAAAEQYRAALAIAPDSARAHFNLANALIALGDRRAAIAHYRAALRLDPRNGRAAFNLAKALTEEKDLEGAARWFRAARRLLPAGQLDEGGRQSSTRR